LAETSLHLPDGVGRDERADEERDSGQQVDSARRLPLQILAAVKNIFLLAPRLFKQDVEVFLYVAKPHETFALVCVQVLGSLNEGGKTVFKATPFFALRERR
jgi:hypothetical protein